MSDVTRATLPRLKSFGEHADELLQRFPEVDRPELLRNVIAHYFIELRFGNKREERAACDFLNAVQRIAASMEEDPK